MPYRIDLKNAPDIVADTLVELGALDIEVADGRIAALLPDAVVVEDVRRLPGVDDLRVSEARGRDDDSVWVLTPRAVSIGGLSIVPAAVVPAPAGALRLRDGTAFGTGLHPTTALCVEAIREAIETLRPERMLDVGTGSGVLALAGLLFGVPWAAAIDPAWAAVCASAENARLNDLAVRMHVVHGDARSMGGAWPLVVANILPAPLIEMAPSLVQRVGHGGRLILSGIPDGIASEVERVYVRLGMRRFAVVSRSGWTAIVLQPTW